MANKTKEVEVIKTTFYIYNGDGTLYKKPKKVYSPFCVITPWRYSKNESFCEDPKYVLFEGGIYETSDEEEILWLNMYNPTWGIVEVNDNGRIIKKRVITDWTHFVKSEAPAEKKKEVVVEKEVEVQQIPRVTIELFTIEQLQSICTAWQVETANCVKKEDYIKLLEESNKLS